MRWFRRDGGRHRASRVVFLAGPAARPTAAPVRVMTPPPLPPLASLVAAVTPRTEEPAVSLGFLDGSELRLPPSDPTARALRAAADALTRRGD